MEPTKCQSARCTNEATKMVYWPGQPSKKCDHCAEWARAVALAMGFDVHIVSLEDETVLGMLADMREGR